MVSIGLLILVLFIGYWVSNSNSRTAAILRQPLATNFIECQQYGYQVSGNNPRICRTVSGQVFTEKTLITGENSRATVYSGSTYYPRTTTTTSSSSNSNYVSYPAPYPYYPTTDYSNTGRCYVGGCSSQICSDQPNAISTCEYREEYSCYRNARCEMQASGQCGWTPTAAFNACLSNVY